MDNRQGQTQGLFMGLSREQIAKILYEEFSRTGFQFNNINAVIPPILGRMFMENGGMAGNYFADLILKGVLGNLNKK